MSIDWSYWSNLAVVDYNDACILSRGFDPRDIRRSALPGDLDAELKRRELIAKSHLGCALPSHMTDTDRYCDRVATGVKLTEFRAWGEALPAPFDFPETFPRQLAASPLKGAQTADRTSADKPLDERERITLLCIIGAMAREQGLDLSQPMKAGETVAAMASELKWTGRSIGEHLKRVGEAMDRRRT